MSTIITKFVRIPIDEIMQQAINPILEENPFFNELDAIRYLIGKQIKQSQLAKRKNAGKRLIQILNQANPISLTEQEKKDLKGEFPELILD